MCVDILSFMDRALGGWVTTLLFYCENMHIATRIDIHILLYFSQEKQVLILSLSNVPF